MADVKQDWADEIARLLGCAACGDIETAEIATALRKAKAEGLREAAGMCGKMARKWTESNFKGTAVGCLELQNLLNMEAIKIEKGESNG